MYCHLLWGKNENIEGIKILFEKNHQKGVLEQSLSLKFTFSPSTGRFFGVLLAGDDGNFLCAGKLLRIGSEKNFI